MKLIDYFFLFWTVVATILVAFFLFRVKIKSQFRPGRRRTPRQQAADDRRLKVFYERESEKIFNRPILTPYDILGISPDATKQEIEKAFKRRIKQYHPDTVSHLGEDYIHIAKARTIQITRAKDELLKKFK